MNNLNLHSKIWLVSVALATCIFGAAWPPLFAVVGGMVVLVWSVCELVLIFLDIVDADDLRWF